MNPLPDDPSFDRRLTVLETRFDTILPTLVTKSDLEAWRREFGIGLESLRGEFRGELEKFRGEFHGELEKLRGQFHGELEKLRDEFRAEMEKLRVEVYKAIHDAMKWTIGIVVTMFIGLLGANIAMFNATKALIESNRPSASGVERQASPVSVAPRKPPVIEQR